MESTKNRYFDWLLGIVCTKSQIARYSRILSDLYNTNFRWTMDRDLNRLEDGLELRKQFVTETGAWDFGYEDCNVLEVMVALAIRMETEIMSDCDGDDRTDEWFWYMMSSLRLDCMPNNEYSAVIAEEIIDDFLDRKFGRTGQGSLFYIPGTNRDMRKVEIWYQMCEYINSIL